MRNRPKINLLTHRIALCTMHDVVDNDGVMSLIRKGVLYTWAEIRARRTNMFSPQGVTVEESVSVETHRIIIRARYDMDISSAAWVYEQRLQSGDRWYKVLGIRDSEFREEFTVISCRMIETGDVMSKPVENVPNSTISRPVPDGVKF